MKYGNEGMDLKKLLLFLIHRFWIVVLAAVAGAFIGGGIYLLHLVVLDSNREYQAQSKVYLDFAPDDTGEVYQYYNGYTWNDLMSTNLILDATMSYLPDDYTEDEVVLATKAEILSDVRLLTITITTSDIERTAQILRATDQALVDMGQREKEFIDIEIIKETEPQMVVADPRLLQAVLVGLVIALVLVFISMELVYILDDRIYVPGDLKCVTEVPFVGFSFTSNKDKNLVERLQNDMEQNLAYLEKENGELKILELKKNSDFSEQMPDSVKNAKCILLSIPYGKIDRSSLSYRIEQLSLRKLTLTGIIIRDADMRFLKWYYNHL